MGSLRILRDRQIAHSSNTDAADSSSSSSAATTAQQTAKAQAQANANVNAVTAQTTQADDADTGASQTASANVKAVVATETAIVGDSLVTAIVTVNSPAATSASDPVKTSSSSSSTSAAQTTITLSSSSSAKPTSGTTTSSSSSSGSSSSSTGSTSSSTSSDSSLSTSAATTTQTPAAAAASSLVPVTSVINGSTMTTEVYVLATSSSTDGSAQATHKPNQDLSTTQEFFDNKAAVGGVFGAVGLVSLILLLAIVLKIVRYRARRNFERELDEQVEKETRAGTPFGFGKDDDDDLNMMGRAPGIADPEKAYGAGYASNNLPGQPYPFGNTAAYATYSSSAAAVQPAYYSPNSTGNGAPRRYPSQDAGSAQFDNRYYNNLSGGGGELKGAGSRGSNGSYGTLNQPPMNAFSPVSGPNAGPVFAPATFNGNYGEYRNVSPPPASASVRSASPTASPYGARPGTPSSLTPGGNRGFQPAAPPRNAFTPLGSRPDSPAILARYGQGHSSSRGSSGDDTYAADAYAPSSGSGAQYLRAPPTSTHEPPSPKAALPNPFDQRD